MKNKTLLALLTGACFALPLQSQAVTDDQKVILDLLQTNARQDNLSYQIIESLTTEVGPRLAGTPGSEKAVVWAQDTMKRLGFDKVWIEESKVPLWTRGDLTASISAPTPIKSQRWHLAAVWEQTVNPLKLKLSGLLRWTH